jgi:hypothetical protein
MEEEYIFNWLKPASDVPTLQFQAVYFFGWVGVILQRSQIILKEPDFQEGYQLQ